MVGLSRAADLATLYLDGLLLPFINVQLGRELASHRIDFRLERAQSGVS